MNDEDYGDITHPSSGRDVVVDFKSAEEVGRSFPETKVRVKPNITPLHEDEKISKKLYEGQKDIHSIFKKEDYDTLRSHLDNWLNNDETESASSKEESQIVSQQEHQTKVENAFDDLFNE